MRPTGRDTDCVLEGRAVGPLGGPTTALLTIVGLGIWTAGFGIAGYVTFRAGLTAVPGIRGDV